MTFGTHGTFYLRDGWVGKIIDAVTNNPSIFSNPEAPIVLGVGKNMVPAMRFWALSSGICERKYTKNGQLLLLTEFGRLIQEYDKHLEKIETIWLLHINLASNISTSSSWFWIYNEQEETHINSEEFPEKISKWLNKNYKRTKISKPNVASRTLLNDIKCFIQSYTKNSEEINPENNLTCPLSSLQIIEGMAKNSKFIINTLNETEIPIEIFEYVLVRYLIISKEKSLDQKTITSDYQQGSMLEFERNVKELLYDPYSPGRILRCSVNGLYELISEVIKRENIPGVEILRTAGLDMIKVNCSMEDEDRLLNSIFAI